MSSRGHTLIELLTVLCLVAVLGGLGLPSLASLRSEARLSTAVDHLLVSLQWARSTSLTRTAPVVLCLSDAAGRCLPADAPSASAYALHLQDPAGELLRHESLPARMALRATRAHITYYPLPRAGSTSTLSLCDGLSRAASRQLIISQTGRVRTARLTQRGCG